MKGPGGITDTKLGSSREAKTSRLDMHCKGRGDIERVGEGRKEPSKPCYKMSF